MSDDKTGQAMSNEPWPWSESAPKLAELTDDLLLGDIWERPGLSKRDRSLITVATLVARYRPLAMPFHMKLALENGVTKDEMGELITHLAFYAGWPNATVAADILRTVISDLEA
jgi:4-carboxymuconolactone decarboxylase